MPRHTDSRGARDLPDAAGDDEDEDEGKAAVSCLWGHR